MSEDKKSNPLDSFDARDWAKEFMRRHRTTKYPDSALVSEELVVGWFANALRCGYDRGLLDQAKNYAEAAARERVDVPPPPPPPLRPVYPEWLDHANVEDLRAFMKLVETLPAFPPERLRDMVKRIEELEARLGSTFLGPERNLTTEVGKLMERVRYCETLLPRPGDRTLGTMHEEVCARLSKLEAATKRLDALAVPAGTESPSYGALSVRCAKAELRVAELEKLLDHEKKTNRMVGEAYMRPRDREEKLKVAVEKWANRAMPSAGARGGWWSRELKEDLG